MKGNDTRGLLVLLLAAVLIGVGAFFGFQFLGEENPNYPPDYTKPSESDESDKPSDSSDEPTPIEPIEPDEPDEPKADVYAYTVSAEGVTITGRGTVTGSYLTIPEEIEGAAVVAIAANAFQGDTKIYSVKIPQTVESIGESAFETCVSMGSIVIPASVQTMGENVFFGCSGLKTIYIEAESAPKGWAENWRFGCSAKVYWGGEWHFKNNGKAIGDDVIELPVVPIGNFVAKGIYDPEQGFTEFEARQ